MPGPTPTRADLPEMAEIEALVRRWLDRATRDREHRAARRLAGLLRDPRGVEFARGFLDRVLRHEDPRAAARGLERLSRRVPRSLPWDLRTATMLGGGFGLLVPWVAVPAARWIGGRLIGHLVVNAGPAQLGRAIERIRADGVELDLHLLGDRVLGEHAGARRARGVRELLGRDDVDRVSLGVRDVVSRSSPWGFASDIDRAVERLLPLARDAARARTPKSLTLEVTRFRDLDLTIAVFTRLLDRPEFRSFEAGIVLPAVFPDAIAAQQEVTAWARRRVADGGAPIRMRIAKGADLALERVDARLHDRPPATWDSKVETDAGFARMLDWAMRPEHTAAVRVGVATQNLFDLAFALLLAERRRVRDRVELEMLLGVAPALADAVRDDADGIRLYAPVVPAGRLETAVDALIRLVDESADAESFLAALPFLDDPARFARERDRFGTALELVDDRAPAPKRTSDRLHPEVPRTPVPFSNEPGTDPAIHANRAWAGGILERAAASRLGLDTAAASRVAERAVRDRVAVAARVGGWWSSRSSTERSEALHRAGEVLAAFRGRLVEVMIAETGRTIGDADSEVSDAVDFAHHAAELALGLERIPGATFSPSRVAVVVSSWDAPLSGPASAALPALAAGSAVILAAAPQALRCAAVLAEALWEAGIPRDLLQLVDAPDAVARQALVAAPEVDRVLLAGPIETAEQVRSWRPDVPLLAETGGANTIVVTPSADPDAAVADLVRSAFAGAGQHRAAASIAILVGSVGESARFRDQLVDAVTSLAAGSPLEPATVVGPLAEPAGGRLARVLTRLEEGESWLVTPRALDDTDRLWSPSLRDGVRPGGELHRRGASAPVLGLLRATTLDEAIEVQNAATGPVAGIQSLDRDEVASWLARVQAGTLFVNRPVIGAAVGRQPVGGSGRSSLGPGTKRGGPNALLPLGTWRRTPAEPDGDLRLDGLDVRVRAAVEAFQSALDYDAFAFVRRAAYEDEAVWSADLSRSVDLAGLGVERNILRFRAAVTWVRLADGGSLADLARVLVAGIRARATLHVSSADPLPSPLLPLLEELRIVSFDVERDDAWTDRVAAELPARVRLVGGDARAVARAIGGAPAVAIWGGEVTAAGRLELLPFLLEQTVSITAHRFGRIEPAFHDLPV